MPRKGYVPFENRSISQLWKMRDDPLMSTYDKQEILTQLLFKIVIPLLAFIVVVAIAPYCITYKKSRPQFLIYTFGIFGFVERREDIGPSMADLSKLMTSLGDSGGGWITP